MSLNRNKRSMTMNFKSEEAKAVFKEMVKKADVVVENFKPGTMKKFGLDSGAYWAMENWNPGKNDPIQNRMHLIKKLITGLRFFLQNSSVLP